MISRKISRGILGGLLEKKKSHVVIHVAVFFEISLGEFLNLQVFSCRIFEGIPDGTSSETLGGNPGGIREEISEVIPKYPQKSLEK